MNKPEAYKMAPTKQEGTKLVKRVSADKNKLQSRQAAGGKTETVKTVGLGCVPVGIR